MGPWVDIDSLYFPYKLHYFVFKQVIAFMYIETGMVCAGLLCADSYLLNFINPEKQVSVIKLARFYMMTKLLST